ncbi:MAG: hypothetical protein JTJ21_06665 [Holdemanella sp.]|nr:hypothetical protein [Holdemanella sp.]
MNKWTNKEIENYNIVVSLDTWKNHNENASDIMRGIIQLPVSDEKLDTFLKENLKYEPNYNDEVFALEYPNRDLFELYEDTKTNCDIRLLNDFAKIWDRCTETEKHALVAITNIDNLYLDDLCNAALQIHECPYLYQKYDFDGVDNVDDSGRTCGERMKANELYGWQLKQQYEEEYIESQMSNWYTSEEHRNDDIKQLKWRFERVARYTKWSEMAEDMEIGREVYFDQYGYMNDSSYLNYIDLEKYDRNEIHEKANVLYDKAVKEKTVHMNIDPKNLKTSKTKEMQKEKGIDKEN